MIEYRYLQPEDAAVAADIHIEGQPGTILTLLGHRFLEELYRAICRSEWAEGVGAYDDGRLVALGVVAVSSARFFGEFKRRYLWRVAAPVTLSVLKNPRIITYVINSWSYADEAGSPEREADVLFLGVKRGYLRQGLAPEVIRCMFGWGNLIGLNTATFMVEKRNRPMRWVVSQLQGLSIAREFEAFGRTMVLYRVPIAANQADARLPLGHPSAHIYSKNGRG